MKPPTIEEIVRNVAEKALDEYAYKGKTLREWMEIIETASEDTISRRAAIEALKSKHDVFNRKDDYYTALKTIKDELPPVTYTKINPPSDYARQFGLIPKEDATKLSTNLAEVGTEAISKQQAIDALVAETIYTEEELKEYYEANSHRNEWVNGIYESIETVKQLPPIQPTDNLQKLADEIASFKRCVKSDNSDYLTGYLCALSVVEGMIADMRGEQDG